MAQVKVSIKVSNGRLQLVYTPPGQPRQYLSLGYPDTPKHRSIAKLTAAEIEKDILLERYQGKDFYLGKKPSPTEAQKKTIALPELWALFVTDRSAIVKASTISSHYNLCGRNIDRCPHGLEDAGKVRSWALANLSQNSARRWMTALNACCKWGVQGGLIDRNPFAELSVPKSKSVRATDESIDAFTKEERDRIIEVFQGSRHYKCYAPFVAFLFYTGCRPGEAIGLEWGHVGKDAIVFQQVAGRDELGRLAILPGLKTQRKRSVPLNRQIREVLERCDRASRYVFAAPGGGLMCFRNFGARAWKSTLAHCEIAYKNPYQMRHTFATLALQSGVSIADIAKLIGNSPDMILKHYAGVSRDLKLPEI